MSSEARGKACGLKMFLSQGKRPVTRQPLAGILPVHLACMQCRIVRRFGRQ